MVDTKCQVVIVGWRLKPGERLGVDGRVVDLDGIAYPGNTSMRQQHLAICTERGSKRALWTSGERAFHARGIMTVLRNCKRLVWERQEDEGMRPQAKSPAGASHLDFLCVLLEAT